MTTPRTDLDFDFFRTRLFEEKALAEEALSGVRVSDADATDEPPLFEDASDENHPGDAGTDVQMRTQDDALARNAKEILEHIEAALARIDDGTYGFSVRSGEAIARERLEAIPYASLTTAEQAVEEGERSVPSGSMD